MLVTKPYLIETASFYAGTSEEVHLRGQRSTAVASKLYGAHPCLAGRQTW